MECIILTRYESMSTRALKHHGQRPMLWQSIALASFCLLQCQCCGSPIALVSLCFMRCVSKSLRGLAIRQGTGLEYLKWAILLWRVVRHWPFHLPIVTPYAPFLAGWPWQGFCLCPVCIFVTSRSALSPGHPPLALRSTVCYCHRGADSRNLGQRVDNRRWKLAQGSADTTISTVFAKAVTLAVRRRTPIVGSAAKRSMSRNRLSTGKKNPSPLNLSGNSSINTLAPIDSSEVSNTNGFFRSGQQSPKPRGRKKVAMPTPTKNVDASLTTNAGTPGTTRGLLDDNVQRATRLSPIQTGANRSAKDTLSPSRGQRSPQATLGAREQLFTADTDLVATPQVAGF